MDKGKTGDAKDAAASQLKSFKARRAKGANGSSQIEPPGLVGRAELREDASSHVPVTEEGLPTAASFESVDHVVLDLFSGVGGLLQALLDSGLGPVLGTKVQVLLFEVDARCRQLLKHHHSRSGVWLSQMPDSKGAVGSAFAICEKVDLLIQFLKRFRSLKSILVAVGSPCVGFSIAKENRQGIRDPESSKLVAFPFLLSRLKSALPDVHVLFMLENVPMHFSPADKAQQAAISQCLGVEPPCLKASSLLPAEREHCFWTNLRGTPDSSGDRRGCSVGTGMASFVGVPPVRSRHEVFNFLPRV